MKAGVVDVLEKPFNAQRLLDCIQETLQMDLKIRETEAGRLKQQALVARLSPREREVMDRILEGETNKEIASHLQISRKTLDIHRARILVKMQAKNSAELAKKVLVASGLIPPHFSFLNLRRTTSDAPFGRERTG
jgi:FixJ family two-component response regulator